ncbi:hypothetical protein TNCT_543081 [Trichonephila clavata]|uniref:Uncharacterized protein n=1 Tax=Trichonephila clavata TaxID=2740835 RepID=A0A8X6GXT3_TRICU|nr:hypothetical protein TNCT_543081 [Trichonephila clavata]
MGYSRYNINSPQHPASSHHHASFFSPQRPTMYPRNQRVSQQQPAALRLDAAIFHPSQRTQENKYCIPATPNMRNNDHPSENQFQTSCGSIGYRIKCQYYL